MIKKSPLILGLAMLMLFQCQKAGQNQTIKTGLDVAVASDFSSLRNKRVGVITNQTGVASNGTHIIDLLLATNQLELVAVFAPEHGLKGNAEAGATIENHKLQNRIPIYSLYGKTRKPTAEMLTGIDVLVFDQQDIGTRYYTYISTMSLTMEAAAEHQIEYVVLDRPNPIGGIQMEGPVLTDSLRSFVGIHPIALRHGMTVGELAQMFVAEKWIQQSENFKLEVIQIKNWQRNQLFMEHDQSWIAPSPNIPDPETALIYPATGWLEGTNISEGRGTKAPFLQFGAPWLESAALIDSLQPLFENVLQISNTTFTPIDLPGQATGNKFNNQLCKAVRISFLKPNKFASTPFGLYLLYYLQILHPNNFKLNKPWLLKLLGNAEVVEALEMGIHPQLILKNMHDELVAFSTIREKYLLYK